MATYTAHENGNSSSGLGGLSALVHGTTTGGNGTSATFTDASQPGVTVTLIGTGISGQPADSWNITDIIVTNSFGLDWTIDGITGVDGSPTNGPFDSSSLFQAETFRNAARLIFEGHNNTINGGPGNEGLFAFGAEGTTQTVQAGSGNDVLSGNGGMDTVWLAPHAGHGLGHGRDVLLFNVIDRSNPMANVTTIHGYSTTKDVIELSNTVFAHLKGSGPVTPFLLPSEFHHGANHPTSGAGQIFYNHSNGHLWYDFFDHATHTEVKDLVAVVYGAGHTHPNLAAHDILIA